MRLLSFNVTIGSIRQCNGEVHANSFGYKEKELIEN
jgi:hypothetical protein